MSDEYLIIGEYRAQTDIHYVEWSQFYDRFDDLKKAQHWLQRSQTNHIYRSLKLYKIEEVKGDGA